MTIFLKETAASGWGSRYYSGFEGLKKLPNRNPIRKETQCLYRKWQFAIIDSTIEGLNSHLMSADFCVHWTGGDLIMMKYFRTLCLVDNKCCRACEQSVFGYVWYLVPSDGVIKSETFWFCTRPGWLDVALRTLLLLEHIRVEYHSSCYTTITLSTVTPKAKSVLFCDWTSDQRWIGWSSELDCLFVASSCHAAHPSENWERSQKGARWVVIKQN